MPELPEVESLRRMLERSAVGRTIVAAKVSEPRLRRHVARDFAGAVAGRRIEGVGRRAKYLIVRLSGGEAILAHLGMSGTLTHRAACTGAGAAEPSPARRDGCETEQLSRRATSPAKRREKETQANAPLDPAHDHVELTLDDASRIVYNDPRRFGLLKLIPLDAVAACEELSGLGPEPLSRAFNAAYLAQKAHGRRLAIKNLMMDQRIVAGIGNIYAAEILFRAGVRPTRRAGRLKPEEVARIVAATAAVLKDAIGRRGTTFRSYRDSRGRPGGFAPRLKVYGREGQPCPTCTTPIRNLIVGQRASFYCPRCQR